jgi:hypothetical protein
VIWAGISRDADHRGAINRPSPDSHVVAHELCENGNERVEHMKAKDAAHNGY